MKTTKVGDCNSNSIPWTPTSSASESMSRRKRECHAMNKEGGEKRKNKKKKKKKKEKKKKKQMKKK